MKKLKYKLFMWKWFTRKNRLRGCSHCGLNGHVELVWSGYWGIFCGSCQRGYISRILFLAIYHWNRAYKKAVSKEAKRREILLMLEKQK